MLTDLIKKLRFSNPWRYKAPLLICWPYLMICLTGMSGSQALFYIILAYSTLFGIAALGYFINDLADIKSDKLAGKQNKLGEISIVYRTFILCILLLVSFVPWVWLPKSIISLLLIIAEIVLFILYSLPPFRFKERGLLGIVTDSLYAYVIPFGLAAITFFYAGDKNYSLFPILIILSASWLFLVGLRGILLHQVDDYQNDLNAGIKTFVTKNGPRNSERLIKILIPVECIFFLIFLGFLFHGFSLLLPSFIIFIASRYFTLKKTYKEANYRKFSYYALDDFYLDFLPVIILIHLLISRIWYFPIIFLHLFLFRSSIKQYIIRSAIYSRFKEILIASYHLLFEKGSYQKRLFIHLGIFFCYNFLFIGIYLWIDALELETKYEHYYQMLVAKYLVIMMVAHLVFVIGVKWNSFLQLVKEYFGETGSAFNLAVFRIIFFFILGGHFIFYSNNVLIFWSKMPFSSRIGLPFMEWYIYSVPISENLFFWSNIISGIFCWIICIGFRPRVFLFLLLPFLFYSLGIPMFFGKISHSHIFLWVPLFLIFSPLGDRLSIDRLLAKNKYGKDYQAPKDHIRYMIGFKFIWLQMAIIYGFAGIIKLWDCGFAWALSDSMIYQMQWEWIENYDKAPGFRIDHYPLLAKAGGMSVIYFELLYVFLIMKPKSRIWAFLGAFSLHKLAGYFMYIDFSDLRLVQTSYIPWSKISRRIIKKSGIKNFKKFRLSSDSANPIFNPRYLKISFVLGIIIIAINFTFSILRIHSYPFSSYPTYSAIVKNELPIVRMDAYDSTGNSIDIKEIGVKNDFHWENVRPYEIRIAQIVESKDASSVKPYLDEYWLLWRNANEELKVVTKVLMYLEYTELPPEKRNVILRSEYIGTIYPHKLKK